MKAARALKAARRARRALALGETRDAAWYALWSTELDPMGGLGLAVVARILHEVSGDALATIVTREAWSRGLPEPERVEVERFLRIDLWSRGLLAHVGGQSLLPAAAFEDGKAFTETEAHDQWIEERTAHWGSAEGACQALRRLVGALSDAWEMPGDVADPLRSPNHWSDMPGYASWKEGDPLDATEGETEVTEPSPSGITVISDYWTEHTIQRLEQRGQLGEAIEIAERWLELRPGRMSPRIALMRLYDQVENQERLEELEKEVLSTETEDLNELEEARVGLGLLQRFKAQRAVLNRMDTLAPGQAFILASRGAAALELNLHQEAEADLHMALQLEPENGAALVNLGLLRIREQDYVAARALLEQAKVVFPREAQVRYYLASCLHAQKMSQRALAEARAALELDPRFTPAQQLLESILEEV
ncbi:MAG: hypothetical protein KTR25_10655 [Myxococcales bacterium]|nr:hypothetical protein [Myxococcales bacterium]